MKRSAVFFVFILTSLTFLAQEKTINGFVTDSYTYYRIQNVIVSPSLYKDTVYTDENGKFKIVLPKKYRDTIVFSHPDYYTYIDRVNIGDASRPQFIKLIPKTFKLDTICYAAYDENNLIRGNIKDAVLKKPIFQAEIRLENNKIIAYADMQGEFEVAIPKTNTNLIINHPEFNTAVLNIKENTSRNHYFEARLLRKTPAKLDTIWMGWNNAISLSVTELIAAAIGLRYERFLKLKHSIGIHSTYYFHGYAIPVPFSRNGTIRFTAIKTAVFYRYYVKRNYHLGAFFEGKFISGYFDFSQLYYYYPEYDQYSLYEEEQFWTFGGGISGGWAFRLPKTKHGLVNLSIGYQFLPMNVPQEITEHYEGGGRRTYEVSKNWWYFTGPGSLLEIKFTIGGIF